MICDCHGCDNEIPIARMRRRNKTCCDECNRKRHIYIVQVRRAKELGKEPRVCEGCGDLFTNYTQKECLCYSCFVQPVKAIKEKVAKVVKVIKKKRPAKEEFNFRAEICKAGGKICEDYSRCSDSILTNKNGAYDYQTNGGKNCYKKPREEKLLTQGNSFGLCTINT